MIYKITVLSAKPVHFYIIKDGKEHLITNAKRGQVFYSEALTNNLRIYAEDKVIKLSEQHNFISNEIKPEQTIRLSVKELLEPVSNPVPAEPAKRGRRKRFTESAE